MVRVYRMSAGSSVLLFALLLGFAGVFAACADTLILNDGRKMTGEVVQTDAGYRITARGIAITMPAGEVKEWVKGGPAQLPLDKPDTITTPIAPRTTPAAAPATRSENPQLTAKRIKALLEQGRDALAAGDFVSARARFLDVMDVEGKQPDALHGLALCQLALGERKRAIENLETAVTEMEKSATKPRRALVLNFAIMQLATANPMRAGKSLVEYLDRQGGVILTDEPLANVLGSACWNSPMRVSGTASPLYAKMTKYYDRLDVQLNSEWRPAQGEQGREQGRMQRWGVKWVPAEEFRTLSQGMKKLEDARLDTVDSSQAIAAAKKRLDWYKLEGALNASKAFEYNRARETYLDAVATYRDRYARWREVQKATVFPEFPRIFATVPMDQDAPPGASPSLFAEARSATPVLRPRGQRFPDPDGDGVSAKSDPAKVDVVPAKPVPAKIDESTPPPLANVGPALAPPRVVVPRLPGRRTMRRYAVAIPVAPNLFLTSADLVLGAKTVTLTGLKDDSLRATVRKSDPVLGLALLEVPQSAKVPPVKLANDATSGPVQCVGLAAGVFDTKIELIPGTLRAANESASASLQREARRPGSPIVRSNEIVGIILADRSAHTSTLPVATSMQIRAFLGDTLGSQLGPFALPEQSIYDAESEVEVE